MNDLLKLFLMVTLPLNGVSIVAPLLSSILFFIPSQVLFFATIVLFGPRKHYLKQTSKEVIVARTIGLPEYTQVPEKHKTPIYGKVKKYKSVPKYGTQQYEEKIPIYGQRVVMKKKYKIVKTSEPSMQEYDFHYMATETYTEPEKYWTVEPHSENTWDYYTQKYVTVYGTRNVQAEKLATKTKQVPKKETRTRLVTVENEMKVEDGEEAVVENVLIDHQMEKKTRTVLIGYENEQYEETGIVGYENIDTTGNKICGYSKTKPWNFRVSQISTNKIPAWFKILSLMNSERANTCRYIGVLVGLIVQIVSLGFQIYCTTKTSNGLEMVMLSMVAIPLTVQMIVIFVVIICYMVVKNIRRGTKEQFAAAWKLIMSKENNIVELNQLCGDVRNEPVDTIPDGWKIVNETIEKNNLYYSSEIIPLLICK